jgi:hypothetical protein
MNMRKPRNRYTPEEIQFIRDNVKIITSKSCEDLLDMFNRRFNCSMPMNQFKNILHNRYKIYSEIGSGRLPIGSEHNKDQYVMVKTGHPNVWRKKHHIIWEKANGPIPGGHVVIFADNDKSNFRLKNLLLVSRRELDVMNRRHLIFPNAEATKAGLLMAKIILQTKDYKSGAKKGAENEG